MPENEEMLNKWCKIGKKLGTKIFYLHKKA